MRTKNIFFGVLAALALAGAAFAADVHTTKRLFSREQLQVHTGSATLTVASPTSGLWTNFNPLITIAPDSNHALGSCRILLDLDGGTTGFHGTNTSQTITFGVSRKVSGGAWHPAANTLTTAISGTNSQDRSLDIDLGTIGPDEQLRIEVKVSATNINFVVPYVLYYQAGVPATVTPVQ